MDFCSEHKEMDYNQTANPDTTDNARALQTLSKLRNFFQSDLNRYIVDAKGVTDNGSEDMFNDLLGALKEVKELIIHCRYIKRICSQRNATESANTSNEIKNNEVHVNSIERCADISPEETRDVAADSNCLPTAPNEHENKLSDDQDLDDTEDLISLHPSSSEYDEFLKYDDEAPGTDAGNEIVAYKEMRSAVISDDQIIEEAVAMTSTISTSNDSNRHYLSSRSRAYEHIDNRGLHAIDTRHQTEMVSPISTSNFLNTQDLPGTSRAYEYNDKRVLHAIDTRHQPETILLPITISGRPNPENVPYLSRPRKNNDLFVTQINTLQNDKTLKKYDARDKIVCLNYLLKRCEKPDRKCLHTLPNLEDMTLLLKQIDEHELSEMINNENLVIKYGQCFATVFCDRHLTKLLLRLAVKYLKNTKIEIVVLEMTLRYINNFGVPDIDCKLLNKKIRHHNQQHYQQKQVSLILIEEILHRENFSIFTKAFLFLTDFMIGNKAAFSYSIAENVLKKVCSSYDRNLAIAFEKITRFTNPKILNHSLIPRFNHLLQSDKDDLKENNKTNTEIDNYNARGDQANNAVGTSTKVGRSTAPQHAACNKTHCDAANDLKRISASTRGGAQGACGSETKSRPMLPSKPYDPNLVDVNAAKKKKKGAKIYPCYWAPVGLKQKSYDIDRK